MNIAASLPILIAAGPSRLGRPIAAAAGLVVLLSPFAGSSQVRSQVQGKPDKLPPRITARIPQIYSPERIEKAFQVFDRDKNGWLSFRELRAALEVDRREYVVIDVNSDGMVVLDEFDRHLQRQLENGAVIPWPDGTATSKPATQPVSATAPAPASGEPFSFGDLPVPKKAGDRSKPPVGSRPASAPAH